MYILICTLVFVVWCVSNCQLEYVKCKTCDQQIVDEINDFRANLICTQGISSARPISTTDQIVDIENDEHSALIKNTVHITHESCESRYKIDQHAINVSVRNFIKSCAVQAENLENMKYSWFWHPKTRRIYCVYSAEPFGIRCVTNQATTNSFGTTFPLDTSVIESVDDYKTYRSNLRFCKQLKNLRRWLKTCPTRLLVRDNIQNQINALRQNLVDDKNISNMPMIVWNHELQMVANEFGKLWTPEYRNIDCISSSQFDNVQLFYLPIYSSIYNYDRYIDPFKTIVSKVRNEIDASSMNGTKPKNFWIYDTSVTDFGCVFQMTARIYTHLVCAYNCDVHNDVAVNFQYGPPCTGCPGSYYCEHMGNVTKLCRRNENDLPYKHFIIYLCIILAGVTLYCYLRHRLTRW